MEQLLISIAIRQGCGTPQPFFYVNDRLTKGHAFRMGKLLPLARRRS